MRTNNNSSITTVKSDRDSRMTSPALDYGIWHARLRSANTPLGEATTGPRSLDLAEFDRKPSRLAA
jgi:hypothetical protein